ncbi:Protein of unknown function (DUF3071) [Parafrankia irregularis]|uniref:DUF3071 domain-containing protein n=1 Tax=Parafrankia irregularis TaxID=795642 RepID=A0A0S4QJC0_9ACTN|nr:MULTISPECIES: septation protein SepH [Parafrankia]MBE3205522.1 DUF3071 domain-containing protein [Parafrankia sp. CH37]CUU55581.1 Protein of unknown function (DUF3071) [Parafrankia irregularis]
MRELRAVALSEDGGYLVLADAAGRSDAEQFRVAVDDRLRAALRGARRSEVRAESALTPREIQARLRAGETAADVARAAGIPVERVERYEGPVLAERARVVQEARAALLPKDPGGIPGRPLGEVVDSRLLSVQDDPETAQWDAWRRVDGIWLVQLTSDSRCARWTWDPVVRRVRPHDDAARALVAPESAEPPPAQPPTQPPARPGGPALTLVHDQGAAPAHPGAMGAAAGYSQPSSHPATPAAFPSAAVANATGYPPGGSSAGYGSTTDEAGYQPADHYSPQPDGDGFTPAAHGPATAGASVPAATAGREANDYERAGYAPAAPGRPGPEAGYRNEANGYDATGYEANGYGTARYDTAGSETTGDEARGYGTGHEADGDADGYRPTGYAPDRGGNSGHGAPRARSPEHTGPTRIGAGRNGGLRPTTEAGAVPERRVPADGSRRERAAGRHLAGTGPAASASDEFSAPSSTPAAPSAPSRPASAARRAAATPWPGGPGGLPGVPSRQAAGRRAAPPTGRFGSRDRTVAGSDDVSPVEHHAPADSHTPADSHVPADHSVPTGHDAPVSDRAGTAAPARITPHRPAQVREPAEAAGDEVTQSWAEPDDRQGFGTDGATGEQFESERLGFEDERLDRDGFEGDGFDGTAAAFDADLAAETVPDSEAVPAREPGSEPPHAGLPGQPAAAAASMAAAAEEPAAPRRAAAATRPPAAVAPEEPVAPAPTAPAAAVPAAETHDAGASRRPARRPAAAAAAAGGARRAPAARAATGRPQASATGTPAAAARAAGTTPAGTAPAGDFVPDERVPADAGAAQGSDAAAATAAATATADAAFDEAAATAPATAAEAAPTSADADSVEDATDGTSKTSKGNQTTAAGNRGRQNGTGRGSERPAGGRRGRKSVPAWDDIVFGARRP